MAAKSMVLMFVGVFCTLIPMHVVLFAGLLILQQGGLTLNGQGADAGVLFVDQKLQMKWIAGNATLNDGDCGSLASCRAECSRATCHPLSGESRQCISLRNSEFYNKCPRDGGYPKMMFDFSRSYVSLSAGAYTISLQTEVARDLRLQRRLDSTFKAVLVPSNFSLVYFGSASGAFCPFPGHEYSDMLCSSFVPRLRPWYLDGIVVSRHLRVLVDGDKSIDQLFTYYYKLNKEIPYLDVAKNMTLALLRTFLPGDNVEVLPFNTTNATSLGGPLAEDTSYSYFNPELAALATNEKALAASSAAGASGLNGAIRKAAGSFNQIHSLKVSKYAVSKYVSSMTCYYQTNIGPANWSCPPLNSSGICPQNGTSNTCEDCTCCGYCALDGSSRAIQKQKWFTIVVALLAILFAIIIIIVVCCCKSKILMSFLPRRLRQPVEEDHLYLNLCESVVNILEKHKATRNLLNKRQCLNISSKLSRAVQNIREIIFCCGASADFFKPALKKLYLDLEKAKLLMIQCEKDDWCRAAVFQIHNEMAFQEILLDVGLCYNAIYEQARSLGFEERNLPEDLRQSSVFMPMSKSDVHEDQVKLKKRLEALANGHKVSGRVSLKQCLARYLVDRLNHPSDANTLDACSTVLWSKENVPTGIWGNSHFLGAGSGASGVCRTKWMGIPCAKKEFHVKDSEEFFLKEASILAHFKHPCIVNFICCGNGMVKGERFIAMELMEKSLYDLIEAQGHKHFSLYVVVDIMVQIVRGMCYLHGQHVAHRDLKPQNVVVNTLTFQDENFYCVKLVDFGMSKTKVEELKSNSISITGVGTTAYRAPEVHPNGEGRADWFKADVFSFAMTCVHMLSLTKPFKDIQSSKLYAHLKDGKRPTLPRDCPEELNSLLKDCWTTNPCHRPTFVEISRRLEAFRFKILRGYPTYQPCLQGKSDDYIQAKIIEYNNTLSRRQLDANHGVVIEVKATDAIEKEIKGMMVVSNPSTRGTIALHTSIEMPQKISQHFRRMSF